MLKKFINLSNYSTYIIAKKKNHNYDKQILLLSLSSLFFILSFKFLHFLKTKKVRVKTEMIIVGGKKKKTLLIIENEKVGIIAKKKVFINFFSGLLGLPQIII